MMKTAINRFFALCMAVFLFAACSDIGPMDTDRSDDASKAGVKITLAFPEMNAADTRALGDRPSKPLEFLDLYLFVFDGERLLQSIHVLPEETKKEAENRISFTVQLPQTDNEATIHIVALDDADGSFAGQIDEVSYGIEDVVIPAYYVSGGKDAYWQRVPLKCRILKTVDNSDNSLDNVVGTETQIQAVFDQRPIPLIRNFAKINLTTTLPSNKFEILGWTVVNTRDAGSVAPWYSVPGDAGIDFESYYDESAGRGKSYNELTKGGYNGVSQAGAGWDNPLSKVLSSNPADWGTGPKYLYERKIASVNPLYILVHGRLYGSSGSYEDGYYKVALGKTDPATGLFTEYNVIRNIEYNLIISAVSTVGAKTVAEAAAGAAYNNVSGDVVTRNMLSISDGVDMLYVNKTRFVVTETDKYVDFQFRYIKNIKSSKTVDNTVVNWNEPGIGIETGDVVKSFSLISTADDWYTIRIWFNEPSYELKQQSFTVYTAPDNDPNGTIGLSRTINLVLRLPWDFIDMETYPGLWTNSDEFPTYNPNDTPSDPNVSYYIGPEKGAPLTIFYELPAGLPESLFPLYFQFESDRQNIENAGVGTAVVSSGPSLFPNVFDYRISYIKELTWAEYTAGTGEGSTPQSRIQRARFVTTTAISYLPGPSYITTVKLHNEYFNDISDQFERDQNKSVTDPS